MFEPFFDQYLPSVTFNGGIPVYVPLHPPTGAGKQSSHEWSIDFDELRYVCHHVIVSAKAPGQSADQLYAVIPVSRAVTPRTKMIIINTPHNPVGKVFTRTELEQIAAIAEEHNLLVMSDEVVSIVVPK